MGVIRYQFVASGADSVIAAYKGISKAAEDSAVRAERAARRVQQTQQRMAKPSPMSGAAAADKRVEHERRIQAQMTQEAQRGAQQRAQVEVQALRNVERHRARVVAAQARAQDTTARDRARGGGAGAEARPRGRGVEGSMLSGALGVIGGVGGAVMGAGMMAGGQMLQSGMQVDEMARRVAINSRLAGGKLLDARTVRENLFDVAAETPGQTAQALGGATLAFQGATGQVLDVDTLKTLATVASAAGANIEDVAAAAAALSNNMDIKGMEDMGQALSVLAIQGAQGQFELKDMAALMGRISSAAAGASVDKSVRGVAQVGALAQIARQGGGSAEQATTAIENVFRNMTSHADVFKKAGVDVFQAGSKGRQLRNTNDVLVESFKKTEGNKTQLGKMFGAQADPIINILSDVFNEEMKRSKNVNQAGEAVRKKLNEAADVTAAKTTIDQAAAAAQQSTTAKVTAAWEKATGKVADRVLPAIADSFTKLDDSGAIDALVDSFEFAADVIAENMQFVSDMMQVMGFSKKGPDLQKELAKTERQEARAQAKIERAKTPAEKAAAEQELKDVRTKKADITGKLFTPTLAGGTKKIGQGGGRQFLTQEKFVEEYVAAMGGNEMTAPRRALVVARASEIFGRVATTGTERVSAGRAFLGAISPAAHVAHLASGGSESEKASALVERIVSERGLMASAKQQQSLGFAPMQELDVESLNKLIAAANGAASALQKVSASGSANVTGAPTGP